MKEKLKLISIFLVLVLVLNIVLPTLNVVANASTNNLTITFRDNYTTSQGKVQYSLDDGTTWVDVTDDLINQAINVTGNNLKIRIVAFDGFSIDLTGITYKEDTGDELELNKPENGPIAGGLMGNNGYQVDSNVGSVVLDKVEFRNENGPVPGPGSSGPVVIDGGTLVTSSFTYSNSGDGDPTDIWLNETEIGVGEPPAGNKDYYKDNSGNVTFRFATFVNSRITSVIINDVDYSAQLPQNKAEWLEANQNQFDMVNITVPYSASYDIKTTTTHNFEWSVGNFLWSYMDQDKGTDNYLGNGQLEFVKLKFNGTTYNGLDELKAANKQYLYADADENEGGAVLPAGAELTVRLIPNAGYQLTAFTCNGQAFTPQEEIGTYTFEVPGGNFHWGATFEKVDDKVKTNSETVKSGSIVLGEEEAMLVGTARLDVKDTEITDEQKAKFKEEAGEFTVSSIVDMSLFNTVFKGSEANSWDTEVKDLENEAQIELQLADTINAEDAIVVHEKHDGTYEKVDSTFDKSTNKVKMKTKGFSNYAIAIKEAVKAEETTETSSNPSTGDSIAIYVSLFAIATFGAFVLIRLNKNSRVKKH